MKIIDTHTHLYFPVFRENLDEVVNRCNGEGVLAQIQIGCDEISSLAALDLAQRFSNFYATLGLHPTDVKTVGQKTAHHRYAGYEDYLPKARNFTELFALFEKIFSENSDLIVGFGETGFDLFHENSPAIFELQKSAFLEHIKLAEKFDRTLVIHSREARKETLDFLKQHLSGRNIRGVLHCFCEDLETAKIVTGEYGFSLGIGGVATYKNAENIREVIREIPLEFLVTETDAPFLVPQNFRKKGEKVNEASFLTEVVELIAELKNMEIDPCAENLVGNARRLFMLEDERMR